MAIPEYEEFQWLIEDAPPTKALRQAKALLAEGSVSDLSATATDDAAWTLRGSVRDANGRTFSPRLEITDDPEFGLDFVGNCSCKPRSACAHMLALLLAVATSESIFQVVFGGIALPPAKSPAPPTARGRKSGSKSREPSAGSTPKIDPAVLGWVRSLASAGAGPASPASGTKARRLLYVLKQGRSGLSVVLRSAVPHGQYRWTGIEHLSWSRIEREQAVVAALAPEDRVLLRELYGRNDSLYGDGMHLEGPGSGDLLQRLVATGRAYWNNASPTALPLAAAEPAAATLAWKRTPDGQQMTDLRLSDPQALLIDVDPLWYITGPRDACGPVRTAVPSAVALAWLAAPCVAPDQTAHVAAALASEFPGLQFPAPEVFQVETVADIVPVPVLTLSGTSIQPEARAYLWDIDASAKSICIARLEIAYGTHRVDPAAWEAFIAEENGRAVRRILRNQGAETEAVRMLAGTGLVAVPDAYPTFQTQAHRRDRTAVPAHRWVDFVRVVVPELRNRGWQVVEDPTFHWRVVEPDAWFTNAQPERRTKGSQEDWFGVELGVVVDGQPVNLLPLLVRLLQSDREALNPARLAAHPQGLPLQLPNGSTLLFPVDRARAMLGILVDLFELPTLGKGGRLRLPRLRAAELAGDADWRWHGPADLAAFAARLRDFRGIDPVPPPPGLAAELRPYQQEGLNWLQFLRQHELGGVLADDMGLGKTVQAIAHLLAEKTSGRATGPSLVVAPTSLMTNWRQEIERFAPALRVLVLHGLDRKDRFADIPGHDVVLTTYPLLPRDLPHLLPHTFHCLILDEAQYIKNPKTGAAQAAHQIEARHRLCLTGTPLENHLGELWSLFHFLMPGFLGEDLAFSRAFRKPIEKDGDADRRKLLARRVAPFLLRRRKEQVARELPPKTEIIQNVELGGAQRDLYETVRLAMHERVKKEVDQNGISRSHILILDALLKLRQICCHPQLLSLPAARDVTESAKTELLFELLPSLIEDGRRILLFSQFTSLLALLEPELKSRQIPYVLLTGQTTDRATPIQRFQSGEVPLFLISLKAGGTGLNLTAADTVIHYDPWWNPAVENQATDRAHRIGQDKQVFVYKLLTVGTVEEKIASLQARKRELVEGLLDGDRPEKLQLTAEDLDVLFAPVR